MHVSSPEPYRLLFPMGVAFGLLGAAVWPLQTLHLASYPGPLHITLMMQGFEQCFVLGFLLTAMPGFTQGPRCHPLELGTAVIAMILFGVGALAGLTAMAQAAFLVSLALLGIAGIRRVARGGRPPEEFLFVAFGLLLGLAGGALLLGQALGSGARLPARFPDRLISLGMVMTLVIGVGSLLVPTFAGMRAPLVIPGVAGPHQRGGRRLLYVMVIAVLAAAFVAELLGNPRLGMSLRAVAVTAMGLWVWKLRQLPRRDAPGFALWGSGWMVMAGLWVAALDPSHAVAGLHVAFIGGFAVLTLAVGTRVMVSHGKHPLALERQALDPWVLALLFMTLAFRILADFRPDRGVHWLSASAVLWVLAWLLWGARIWPALIRRRAL